MSIVLTSFPPLLGQPFLGLHTHSLIINTFFFDYHYYRYTCAHAYNPLIPFSVVCMCVQGLPLWNLLTVDPPDNSISQSFPLVTSPPHTQKHTQMWVCFEGCWTQCSGISEHYNDGRAESYLLGEEKERNVCVDTERRPGLRRKAWLQPCFSPVFRWKGVVLVSQSTAAGTICRDF